VKIAEFQRPITVEFLAQADEWLRRLIAANQDKNVFPEPRFSTMLAERWFLLCRMATDLGMSSWNIFWRSPLAARADLSLRLKLNFRLLCQAPWIQNLRQR
jgi:hypothetical protein